MHPTPATFASASLLLAALALVVLTAVVVRPEPSAVVTQAAPGPQTREHEREPRGRRTQRRGAGRRNARPAARSTPAAVAATATPVETAAPVESAVPSPDARTVVEDYYRALDARRFERAWATLAPAVRAAFGGFEGWRDGYATTRSSTPRDIEVAQEGGVTTIAHELVTEDRSSCGPVRRVFAVRWELVATAGGWRATSLGAVKRSGLEPAEACGARHDPARAAGGS